MTTKKNQLLLGAHMSIAGGVKNAIKRGEEIGCTAIQIFTKSNRQWYAKPLPESDIQAFKSAAQHSPIGAIVGHASYLINVAAPHEQLAHKSTVALIEELNRCAQLAIPYLVLHPGSRLSQSLDVALEQVTRNLDHALHATEHVSILLETMAGQGSSVGSRFEELAAIRALSKYTRRIGFCVDTCHIFAAGYDFSTEETYKELIKYLDATLGLHNIHAIHMNGSKGNCGDRLDRHANIGEGKLPLSAFRFIMRDHRFAHVPKILETPRATSKDYIKNMNILKKLLD